MDKNNISVEEVMRITHKSRKFIINATQQGCFLESVVISGKRRNVHIPRRTFEDYMNKFNKSPSEQLIIALLSFLNEKKASYQKISVLKTYTIKWHYYSFIKIICIF